ncbi:hypothetical protein GALMADRAFT_1311106 [Galerina marginata CBS 339.88]|uniref:Uncharacterized protein n=1 Tax=Galerina marginata (strain CBS 339.88) TaxID=685588 RepID=A0A067T503_GALM3|nr:hypothetical protein GALMADRAFT_1311106 [Galerina marginata CBS 339.88]
MGLYDLCCLFRPTLRTKVKQVNAIPPLFYFFIVKGCLRLLLGLRSHVLVSVMSTCFNDSGTKQEIPASELHIFASCIF